MRVRALCVVLAMLAITVSGVQTAEAVKYMKLGEAVKSFLPKGAKVFKVTKKLTAGQKARLTRDYGWKPAKAAYTFYVGRDKNGEAVGYVIIVPEIFNTCYHKYAIGMKPDGKVIGTAVVELSCPRATPINRKGFLKQFRHKSHEDALTIKSDIDAVSGATLSSESTAVATRKAVSLHNLFFGGGKQVNVSAKVKKARANANSLIEKAIETGETLGKDGKPGAAQLPENKKK